MKHISIRAFILMLMGILAPRERQLPRHQAVLRPMNTEDSANVQLILMAVIAAIVLAVSIVIVYSVMGGINYDTVDTGMGGHYNQTGLPHHWIGPRPAYNASYSLQTNLATFYQVGPIYLVVLAAVGIISAIMMIVVNRGKK